MISLSLSNNLHTKLQSAIRFVTIWVCIPPFIVHWSIILFQRIKPIRVDLKAINEFQTCSLPNFAPLDVYDKDVCQPYVLA